MVASSIRINGHTQWLVEVRSVVRHGRRLSPLLFAIVMDWCIKHTVRVVDKVGLKLTNDKWLTDLCYADDVALTDDLIDGLQTTMDSVACWAEKVGLYECPKTKWMAVGSGLSIENGQIMINGKQMEPVEEFCKNSVTWWLLETAATTASYCHEPCSPLPLHPSPVLYRYKQVVKNSKSASA